jgi:hypothetical protein
MLVATGRVPQVDFGEEGATKVQGMDVITFLHCNNVLSEAVFSRNDRRSVGLPEDSARKSPLRARKAFPNIAADVRLGRLARGGN